MRKFLENQRENLFLYVPFVMVAGGALYFGLSFEPTIPYSAFTLPILTLIITALMLLIRRPIFVRAILIFIFGFIYAATFTNIVDTPKLMRTVRNTNITATVTDIDYTPESTRIFLRIATHDIGIKDSDFANVRVSFNSELPLPNVGDTINVEVNLFPPSNATAPETFDYARWAYFNGISATGFMTEYSVINNAERHSINSIRDYLHNKSKSFLSDGLILGYKNSVPNDDKRIWTTAGIGHVWSISGFHFALMSGWMFAIFYLLFRMTPRLTNRIPARVSAMCAVWIMLMGYLAISGGSVATIRAFLMISLVIAAMILGRSAISLRNVCLVFCIVFLINPHYIMQAGFQLSFSAVFGLVWFWNDTAPRMPSNKILKVLYAATLTSIVATIFTTPFVIAHFYSVPLYGLIGNLVLLPIFSLAIMPCAAIGTITAIAGITAPLDLAHMIYNHTLAIANMITELPGASITMPHVPNTALCLTVLGFISTIFIRGGRVKVNYILGTTLIIAAITVTALHPRPVFFATSDHDLVAFEYDNHLEFNKSRASNHFFAFDTWRRLHGDDAGGDNIRRKPDGGVWIYKTENFNLAYIQKFVPLQNNIVRLCRDDNIDYIVSYFNIRTKHCHAKILRGGFVIYPSGHVHYTPARRRWHIQH
ncbi:MAG: ComEC family competence protein [Alphaproteobacteria bacterium]|nr:ComEC family competence protein [Alphaproteobacteria bacterium]